MTASKHQQGSPTGNPDADQLLRENGNALVIGILLDQQVRAEMAFEGPYKIKERLGHLDMGRIAEMNEDDLAEVFGEKPAVHRFYNMMAGRVQKLAKAISERFGGDVSPLWGDDADLDTIEKRAGDLPGFGPKKAGAMGPALELFGHRHFGTAP